MSLIPTDNFRNPAAILRFFGVCAAGLAADLLVKVWAFRALTVGGPAYKFVPGWLHFEAVENRGAVFGLGQGQRWLFVGVSIVAIVFLSSLFAKTTRDQRFYQVLLGMLLAGVLGNLYDRIVFAHVRDMIHALPESHWPGTWQLPLINYPDALYRSVFPYIFNVADSLLCVGVLLMIVYSAIHKPEIESEPRSREAAKSNS